jgi:hypothetical protein
VTIAGAWSLTTTYDALVPEGSYGDETVFLRQGIVG